MVSLRYADHVSNIKRIVPKIRELGMWGGERSKVRFGAAALPTYHMAGLFMQLCYPLGSAQAVAVFPPRHPSLPELPHSQNVYEVCKLAECTGVVAVPVFIEVSMLLVTCNAS